MTFQTVSNVLLAITVQLLAWPSLTGNAQQTSIVQRVQHHPLLKAVRLVIRVLLVLPLKSSVLAEHTKISHFRAPAKHALLEHTVNKEPHHNKIVQQVLIV